MRIASNWTAYCFQLEVKMRAFTTVSTTRGSCSTVGQKLIMIRRLVITIMPALALIAVCGLPAASVDHHAMLVSHTDSSLPNGAMASPLEDCANHAVDLFAPDWGKVWPEIVKCFNGEIQVMQAWAQQACIEWPNLCGQKQD
jgi:hypothetical protein